LKWKQDLLNKKDENLSSDSDGSSESESQEEIPAEMKALKQRQELLAKCNIGVKRVENDPFAAILGDYDHDEMLASGERDPMD